MPRSALVNHHGNQVSPILCAKELKHMQAGVACQHWHTTTPGPLSLGICSPGQPASTGTSATCGQCAVEAECVKGEAACQHQHITHPHVCKVVCVQAGAACQCSPLHCTGQPHLHSRCTCCLVPNSSSGSGSAPAAAVVVVLVAAAVVVVLVAAVAAAVAAAERKCAARPERS